MTRASLAAAVESRASAPALAGARRDRQRLEVLAGRARSARSLAESMWGCPITGGLLEAWTSPPGGDRGMAEPSRGQLGASGPVLHRNLVWRLPDPRPTPVGTTRVLVALDLLDPRLAKALAPDRPAVPLEAFLDQAGVSFTRRVLDVEHTDIASAWFRPLREAHPGADVLRVTRWWCLSGRPMGADRLAVLIDELVVPPVGGAVSGAAGR